MAALAGQSRSVGHALVAGVLTAIIGGVVAKVGGTVFDGSVTTQLEHMRRRLTS